MITFFSPRLSKKNDISLRPINPGKSPTRFFYHVPLAVKKHCFFCVGGRLLGWFSLTDVVKVWYFSCFIGRWNFHRTDEWKAIIFWCSKTTQTWYCWWKNSGYPPGMYKTWIFTAAGSESKCLEGVFWYLMPNVQKEPGSSDQGAVSCWCQSVGCWLRISSEGWDGSLSIAGWGVRFGSGNPPQNVGWFRFGK